MTDTLYTRVLVIDSDPLVASLHAAYVDATERFEACGVASTATVALELARLRRPDLVLLDLHLAGAASLLFQLQPLPVVGITSGTFLREVVRVYPYVRSLLLKPFAFGTFRDHFEPDRAVAGSWH